MSADSVSADSSDDTDDGFVQRGFGRKGSRGGTIAASGAVGGGGGGGGGSADGPALRFRPDERRLASAKRAHARAVQSVLDIAAASCNLTLSCGWLFLCLRQR